jgi:glycosyltransferase 2 family protein
MPLAPGMARPARAAIVALALAGAAVLVLLVFFRIDWRGGPALVPRFDLAGFVARLPAHAGWLAPFVAVVATLAAWRAVVWRAVCPRPPPRLAAAYHATALGALVHNTIPGKLGPVAAAWILARGAGTPLAAALSSQLVAKLVELGAVVAVGAAAALATRPDPALSRAVLAGAALFGALALAALVAAVVAPGLGARVARRLPRAGAAVAALGAGLSAVVGRRLALALAVALGPALTSAAAYGFPLRAAGVEGSAAAGALLVAVITFGQLTPGLPVGAGVYWGLSAWAARRLGASDEDAAALAVLSHAGMVASSLAVGLVSALVRRAALVDLLRRRREVAGLARAPTPTDPTYRR